MRYLHLFFLICLVAAGVGCARDVENMKASRVEASPESVCAQDGFQPGTMGFAKCVNECRMLRAITIDGKSPC